MPGGLQGDQEEVVITGDALVKRCPQQEGRRGDVIEPDYGGLMQVHSCQHAQYLLSCTCLFSQVVFLCVFIFLIVCATDPIFFCSFFAKFNSCFPTLVYS